jgi:AcrR family transcriptional regulator
LEQQSINRSRQEVRADRILDAAGSLILRWGYNKTTIDDIAREAGVAKGTIYLHWTTREELFVALIRRERAALRGDVNQRVRADPGGATLRVFFRQSALALFQRPLLKAILVRDMDVIGRLAHGEHTSELRAERLAGFTAYLEFLREHGLVRTDLSLQAQVYSLSAIFMGFFLVAPLMPEGWTPSDEEIAELLAETVHRTLESGRAAGPEEIQQVSAHFLSYLEGDLSNHTHKE